MAARLTYLDTHVVAWLYATGAEMLSLRAARAVANDDLHISPMVRLDLRYLHEIGRLREAPQPVIEELTAKLGLRICPAAFSAVVLGRLRDIVRNRALRDIAKYQPGHLAGAIAAACQIEDAFSRARALAKIA